jgi:hypothetical protein
MPGLFHDSTVAAPGITVQFRDSRNESGPDRVQMDITNQCQKIIVFVAEDGFIAVLEQMARAAVPPVIVLSVPRKELSHYGRYPLCTALEEDMKEAIAACQVYAISDTTSPRYTQSHPQGFTSARSRGPQAEENGWASFVRHEVLHCRTAISPDEGMPEFETLSAPWP